MTRATRPAAPAASVRLVRCAVYTRKSTEEGLEQEFNSLDAQREAGEAFVKSQAGEGWTCLPDRYDDGGFTDGNTDRRALRRLLADVEAGRIDCVVVYKVDRLSRSLLDFAGLMRTFETHNVSFVSLTQQFSTATSMGRLILNVLLSFAQFEREIIAERTRDKIAATRRKGKWAGGWPVLGYDVAPGGHKLTVNPAEAERVRQIFDLYLEHEALLPVVEELTRRGWTTKSWTTRSGKPRGGEPFTRTGLYKLLTNVLYAGKVRYKTEVHPGEQPALVDAAVWERTQTVLARNGRSGGATVRDRFGAILKGILKCGPCGCAMTPSHSTRGDKRYRYYVCSAAQKKGWKTCPSKAVPAAQVEQLVVRQLQAIGKDPTLVRDVLAEARRQDEGRTADLESERHQLETDLRGWHKELRGLAARSGPDETGLLAARLADLHERAGTAETRVRAIRDEVKSIQQTLVGEAEAALALSVFDPVWGELTPREQRRVVGLLIEQVTYDGSAGKLAVSFRPAGIRALAREVDEQREVMNSFAV
jgi:site-specific DNA recombinase